MGDPDMMDFDDDTNLVEERSGFTWKKEYRPSCAGLGVFLIFGLFALFGLLAYTAIESSSKEVWHEYAVARVKYGGMAEDMYQQSQMTMKNALQIMQETQQRDLLRRGSEMIERGERIMPRLEMLLDTMEDMLAGDALGSHSLENRDAHEAIHARQGEPAATFKDALFHFNNILSQADEGGVAVNMGFAMETMQMLFKKTGDADLVGKVIDLIDKSSQSMDEIDVVGLRQSLENMIADGQSMLDGVATEGIHVSLPTRGTRSAKYIE